MSHLQIPDSLLGEEIKNFNYSVINSSVYVLELFVFAVCYISPLFAAAMAACTDNDKVHVNGIRALGNLLAIQQVSSPQQMQMPLSLSADRKTDPPSKPQLPTGSDDSCSNISHEVVDVTCAHFTHGDVEAALISGLGDIKLDQWWGRSWLGQSIQCLETSLASSTEKVNQQLLWQSIPRLLQSWLQHSCGGGFDGIAPRS